MPKAVTAQTSEEKDRSKSRMYNNSVRVVALAEMRLQGWQP
eukprot:IDg19159t1